MTDIPETELVALETAERAAVERAEEIGAVSFEDDRLVRHRDTPERIDALATWEAADLARRLAYERRIVAAGRDPCSLNEHMKILYRDRWRP